MNRSGVKEPPLPKCLLISGRYTQYKKLPDTGQPVHISYFVILATLKRPVIKVDMAGLPVDFLLIVSQQHLGNSERELKADA